MAAIPQISPEIARLLESSEAARACLGREMATVRQCLNAPAKVAGSLRSHPLGWLAGALGTGFAASLLLRRKPKPTRKSWGVRSLLLGLVGNAVRPVVKSWLTGQLRQLLASFLHAKSPPSAISLNSDFSSRP